jgi:hypothetical protein
MSVLNNVKNNREEKLNVFGAKVNKVNVKKEEAKVLNIFDVHNIVTSFGVMNGSGNPGVGDTTNKSSNQLALSFCPETASKALVLHFNLSDIDVKKNAGVKYEGLKKKLATKLNDQEYFCADNREVYITMVNNDMVEDLIDEMSHCDLLDEENIEKIFWDLTVFYRMYQERIIDSAKKAYKVVIHIAIECYRALSLQKVKFVTKYSEDKAMVIKDKKIRTMAGSVDSDFIIYKPTPDVQLADGTDREFFMDPIAFAQFNLASFLESLIVKIKALEIEMPEEEAKRLMGYKGDGPVEDLNTVVKYGYYVFSNEYRSMISNLDRDEDAELYKMYKEAYNKATDTLKIVTRQLLDGYTPEDTASIMQFIACNGTNGFDPSSSNQIAINLLTEEYMTMVVNNNAEVKVMGYPVLVNASGLKEGDVVNFVNGISNNQDVLDMGNEMIYATGDFEITKFNGRLYAVQDIKFDIPKADYSKRVFFVRPNPDMNLIEITDGLKEGSTVSVHRDGIITKQGEEIAEVKYYGNGVGIEKLLGVTGTITYLKVVEREKKAPQMMFELSNVEELVADIYEDDEIIDDFTTKDNTTNYDDGVEFIDDTKSTNNDEYSDEDFEAYDDEIEDDFDDAEIEL